MMRASAITVSTFLNRTGDMMQRQSVGFLLRNRHTIGFLCGAIALSPLALAAPTLDKIAKSGTIVLGYRDAAAPFAYLDDNKRPIGYSIDICLKIVDAVKRELKRSDLSVKYIPVSAANRLTALTADEIDLECGSTTSTPERRKQVASTIPTFVASARLLVAANSGIKSIYDLNGKTVVTTKGTSSETLFNELNKNHTLRATLILGNDHNESFSILEAGKAKAFIMDDVLLATLRASSKAPDNYVLTRDPLTIEALSIMLRKDDAPFKKLVDNELHRAITQGEINVLYRKWFESPIPPKQINLKMPMSYLLRDSFKSPTDWLPN